MAVADFNPVNLVGLSFQELYKTVELLRYIMNRIGITVVQSRNKIISDGCASKQLIVNMDSKSTWKP